MDSSPVTGDWRIADFDFDLPPEAVALRPAEPRDSARLLAVGDLKPDRRIGDLPGLLKRGDVLVFNDTRVIAAQLTGQRGDVAVNVTLHQRLLADDDASWTAFAKPGKRLRPGHCVTFAGSMEAEIVEKRDLGEVVLRFSQGGAVFDSWLDSHGDMPLPPYISGRRAPDKQDREDYQTVFADQPGAVAAPTAGLHFTPGLLSRLEAAGIGAARVTLNVGAGTFQPVKTDHLADHRMHAEWGRVGPEAAEAVNTARAGGGRVVAVGTTALRLLETVAGPDGRVRPWQGETRLFIAPGHDFRCVNRLLTNFHLPRSTLFVLVCAFAGRERMLAAYAHARRSDYRFYSYGDACLLSRPRTAA